MRERLIYAATIGAILAGVIAASALAATITMRAGNLKLTVGGTPFPSTLPKKKLAPVGLKVRGKIQTTDGTHPSALREVIIEENNAVVNAKGLPVCRGAQLEARNTKAARRICGKAIVGRGSAHAEISFPEQKPINVASPLLIFNGGAKGDKTTMYVHTFITVPVPAAIVTTITIKKVRANGLHAVVKVPVIAGGSGSAVDFQATIDRKQFTYKRHKYTYWAARCPSGRFTPDVKAVFKNEARIEGVASETKLAGTLAVPCTPRG